jgi:hypothetical protein
VRAYYDDGERVTEALMGDHRDNGVKAWTARSTGHWVWAALRKELPSAMQYEPMSCDVINHED